MEDGFHLNIAIVTDRKAWDSKPNAPKFESTHFAKVYLGRDREPAIAKAADFATRFPAGDLPGAFKLSLTVWQSRGESVSFEGSR